MKTTLRHRSLTALLVFSLSILFSLPIYSQTFHGFASTPADGSPQGGPGPIAVTPPGSMQNGDLVVVYVHYRGSGVTLNNSAAAGQIWNIATNPGGSSNQTFAIFWCRFNGTWVGNPSFSVSAGGNALSAIMYVFRPTATSKVWVINVGPTNGAVTNTAVSITGHNTTLPRTVTMGFWGSPSSNTWGAATAGWTKAAAQFRNTSGQSHTGAYKILAAAGATGNVSQTQSSSQVTKTTIISWAEVDPPTNNECIGATPLNSSTSCSTIPGTLTNATYNGDAVCGATNLDVWYSFQALSTNPTITTTLTSGSGQRRTELYEGVCGALTSLGCSGDNNNLVASGLTVGNTYYVRVYSNNTSPYNFNICVVDPAPGNNLCGNSILLNSSGSCTTPTSGNMYGSTLTGITTTTPDCATSPAPTYDIWYHFTAQRTNPTITLSNLGGTFGPVARLQLFTNNCTNPLVPLFCGTTVLNANFLTPGTTYKIRVYGTGAVPTTSTGNEFDICITDPTTPPSNDECSGAVNLSVNLGCSNLAGDMAGATLSSIPTACGTPPVYDVWYKFAAVNTNATVTLSSFGGNFLATRGVEVFSTSDGTCGGTLTSIGCNATSLALTTLTPGNTYFVRAYSTTLPLPNGNARFNICVQSNLLPNVRFGNSYVNISKKTTGGVVEKGDTLEIRMTINYTSGTSMSRLRFVDNVPSNTTMLTGTNDSLRIITNEGLTYKKYSLAADTDPATFLASPPSTHYNIRMNLGFGTSNPGVPPDNSSTNTTTTTGTMVNGNFPRGAGNLLFATAYRVEVTGDVHDTITLNPAQFIYYNGTSDITLTATPYKILISEPLSLCTNSIGLNNATEYAGTFGSGTTLNRTTDLATPISGYNFLNNVNEYNGLGDGYYAIVKNISPRSSTNRNAAYRREGATNTLAFNDPYNRRNRMHDGHWYIDGDHTGTYNVTGNVPPAEPTNSGYMLMVNADYVASEVFVQTINNLCPNTYYEFSAWFRNICPTCGADSTGAQWAGTPTAPTNGYPGVYPNLSFALNGLDYYSTGEIDTVGWLKKGFVFRTDSTQTTARFSIRNNSQGGGGNDWVMDDIAVATCLPTMSYSPTINPNVCQFNPITIADTISSFFDNYTTYKWQRSTNGGVSWTDITGVTSLPDTNYYITSYTVPPAFTTLADSGNLYRVVVATTSANLINPNCNISDGVTITLSVTNCDPVLDINLLYFNGKLNNEYANLYWATSKEDRPYTFTIEKSTDQVNFIPIGTVNSHNNPTLETNNYSFADPTRISGKVWYRLAMTDQRGSKKYSRIISLNNIDKKFAIGNVINPFDNKLYFEVIADQNTKVDVCLIDVSGKSVMKKSFMAYTGVNSLNLDDTGRLPQGVYALRIEANGVVVSHKVIKKD